MTDETATQRLNVSPKDLERIIIVGDGPVARALGGGLERAGAVVSRWWRKTGRPLPEGEVYVLAVSDGAIGEVGRRVMAGRAPEATPPILLSCSGALPPEEVFAQVAPRPLGAGLLHPLRALAGGPADVDLNGTVFAVAGDEPGRDAALRLCRRLGGVALELASADLGRYHAAAVLVSNHAVGLVDAGVALLVEMGLPAADATRALAQLLRSTADNLSGLGLPDALTGPLARGDVEGVARHLLALRGHKDIDALYRATARRIIGVAARKGRLSPDAVERLNALLLALPED